MAEGEENIPEDDEEKRKYYEEKYPRPECNIRIEELSKPNKVHLMHCYKDYKKHLPKRNIDFIMAYLAEEFAKSSEETEKLFADIVSKFRQTRCRRKCFAEARRKHVEKLNDTRRKNMIKFLIEIVKKFMIKAYVNPKAIMMTNRLRRTSNTILKELCRIRKISIPNRASTSTRATLMYAIADYFAFSVDALYYELQLMKVRDYDELQKQKQLEKQKLPPDTSYGVSRSPSGQIDIDLWDRLHVQTAKYYKC